jgi:hypothetical protein
MMTQELYVVAVDVGGYTVPMLLPFSDVRCPTSGADVDHVAAESRRAAPVTEGIDPE